VILTFYPFVQLCQAILGASAAFCDHRTVNVSIKRNTLSIAEKKNGKCTVPS
jgi:hypothetical protein